MSTQAKYFVYAHFHRDELIYIGCGIGGRPYNRTSRNRKWKDRVGNESIEVRIISQHRDRDLARLVENRLILTLEPPCNLMAAKYYDGISAADLANGYGQVTARNVIRNIVRKRGWGVIDLPTTEAFHGQAI